MCSSRKFYRTLLEPLLEDNKYCRQYASQKLPIHIAILVRRGQVLSVATNRLGTRSKGAGYSFNTIHAERNCVRQLANLQMLRGSELIVVRIPPPTATDRTTFMKSKPCEGCQCFLEKCIREYGLKRVIYSEGEGCEGISKGDYLSRKRNEENRSKDICHKKLKQD